MRDEKIVETAAEDASGSLPGGGIGSALGLENLTRRF